MFTEDTAHIQPGLLIPEARTATAKLVCELASQPSPKTFSLKISTPEPLSASRAHPSLSLPRPPAWKERVQLNNFRSKLPGNLSHPHP